MAGSFFASTGLTICALIFLILIIIMISSKLQSDTDESKIFIWNLYLTVLLLLLEIITAYTIPHRELFPKLNEILCESYIFLSIIWEELFVIYTFFLLHANKVIERNKRFYAMLLLIVLIGIAIPSLAVSLLDISYIGGVDGYPSVIVGSLIDLLHLFSFVGAITIIIIFIINKDKIKNMYLSPLLVAFAVFCISFLLQRIFNFYINQSGFFFALIMAFLYFTVESQDSKLMETVQKTKEEAEEANKVKTEFLMNISHEIRTPLNTILGFSEALLREKELTYEKVKEDCQSINMASISLLNLINNVLDISKIESGKEKLDEKNYDLESIIFEVNSYIPAKINKNDLKFSINVDEDIPKELYGDYQKIYKIVILVLSNAIEYTNYGEVKLDISSKSLDDNSCELQFHISNTGHAMKTENFEKDYYDFVKLENESEATFDSTLLGLIVAKRLLSILGGNIEFINETGKGTQYIIKVKQKVVGEEKLGNIFDSNKVRVSSSENMLDLSGKRALIVDDNKVNIKIASRLLERYKFDIETATSGLECINLIKNNKYDIIFLDHMMPEMDGIQTLKNLKQSGYKIPPVIALTANYYSGLREEYLTQGFTDYLSKPIEFKELNKIINKIFDNGEV